MLEAVHALQSRRALTRSCTFAPQVTFCSVFGHRRDPWQHSRPHRASSAWPRAAISGAVATSVVCFEQSAANRAAASMWRGTRAAAARARLALAAVGRAAATPAAAQHLFRTRARPSPPRRPSGPSRAGTNWNRSRQPAAVAPSLARTRCSPSPCGRAARGAPPACRRGATGACCSAAAGAARQAAPGGSMARSDGRRRSARRERQGGQQRDAPSSAAADSNRILKTSQKCVLAVCRRFECGFRCPLPPHVYWL